MSHKLFFDIETIPDQHPGAFDKHLDAVHPPRNYKNQKTIDDWMLDNAERIALEEFHKTALNGLLGEICSISWAINDGNIKNSVRTDKDSEAVLLETFWDELYTELRELSKGEGNWPQVEWVGHNVIDFDLRFLKQRCIINQVEPGRTIPADARHGTGQVFDTMKEWCGTFGSVRYVKQDDLCHALGIVAPSWAQHVAMTDGSQVWEFWRNGEYELLTLYNSLDVFKVREIYNRMHYR